jgi:hypothetical protein
MYVAYIYGVGHPLVLLVMGMIMSLPYVPIFQWMKDAAIIALHLQCPVVYMEPPAPLGAAPEVVLLMPHGFISIESIAAFKQWTVQQNIERSTLFVDKTLHLFVRGANIVFRMFEIDTDILGHTSIDQRMQTQQQTLAVIPGGFGDAVAGSKSEQIVFLGTTSYWIKQCKKHGYALRIFHTYNGSQMIEQSSFALRKRAQLAMRFHLPILLPTTSNKVSSLSVRCLFYPPDSIPTVMGVQEDLVRYTEIDKQSPLFPDPLKVYSVLSPCDLDSETK